MRRIAVPLLVCWLAAPAVVTADTVRGRVNPDRTLAWEFVAGGGLTSITLHWSTRAAVPAVFLDCRFGDDDFIAFGTSVADVVEQVLRLDTFVPLLFDCVLAVTSLERSTKFTMNVQDGLETVLAASAGTAAPAPGVLRSVDLAEYPEIERRIDRVKAQASSAR